MQAASPALEKVVAGHALQTELLVAEHGVEGKRPAAHVVQAVQGAKPEAL